METTGFVVSEGLFKEAKDAHIRHKNNERRKKRERAKVNGLRRRQLKVKMERVDRLEKEVSHLRLDKVLDEIDSGKMTGKRRIKTNSPDSESKSKLESLIAHQQNLNNELLLKIEFVKSMANNASDLNLFKDRMQEKFELLRLKKDLKGLTDKVSDLTRENDRLKHLNNRLRAEKCSLKGTGFKCSETNLKNLVASGPITVTGLKKMRAVPGESQRETIEQRDTPDHTEVDREVKTEGTDDEANESVKPVVGTAPNNENTRVVRNKVSPQKGALNRHAEVHSTDVSFGCDICGKNFKRKDVLKRHTQIHSTDTHSKCDICGRICPREDALKRHMRIHSTGVPFECDICGKNFKRKDALKEHKKGTRKAGICRPLSVGEVNQESVKDENLEDVKEYWSSRVEEL